MVEIKGEVHRGWHLEVGVERRADGAFAGQYFIVEQVVRPGPNGARGNVPHNAHVGGPYPTPDEAFAKGFSDCRETVDKIADRRKASGQGEVGW